MEGRAGVAVVLWLLAVLFCEARLTLQEKFVGGSSRSSSAAERLQLLYVGEDPGFAAFASVQSSLQGCPFFPLCIPVESVG